MRFPFGGSILGWDNMQTPIVTRSLLALNILAFVFTIPFGGREFFQTFGLVPGDFRVWQPLTSMFLHGGLAHIIFNMLALWSIGAPIERDLGPARFLTLYVVSGLAGAALVLFLPVLSIVGLNLGDPYIPTVGASGAISGLLGALAIFYPRATMLLFFVIPVRARSLAIGFGLLSLVLLFFQDGGGISHSGHLGGLLGGLAYSWFAVTGARAAQEQRATVMPPENGYGFDRARLMRQLLRDLMRDPRTGMAHGGRFLDPYATLDRYDSRDRYEPERPFQTRAERDVTYEPPRQPAKRLYYDPVTGTFFFR